MKVVIGLEEYEAEVLIRVHHADGTVRDLPSVLSPVFVASLTGWPQGVVMREVKEERR